MTQQNLISANGGSISIGSFGVYVTGSGQGSSDDEITAKSANSRIVDLGGIAVTEPGNGQSSFIMSTDFANSPIIVGGNVNYDNHLNQTGSSYVCIYGHSDVFYDRLQIDGALILDLADSSGKTTSNGASINQVAIGSSKGIASTNGTIVYGATKITGESGPDTVSLTDSTFEKGFTIDLNGTSLLSFNNQTIADLVSINGCSFNGQTSVTLTGPKSVLTIDNDADSVTQFSRPFVANLTGSNPTVLISTGTAPGNTDVIFGMGANFNAKQNSGAVLKYHSANVVGSINSTNFSVQLV
jgi:hypothetical protein